MFRSGAFGALYLVALAVVAGCGSEGPELAPVSGAITMNGEPFTGVVVEFQPKGEGAPSFGMTDEAGNYELAYTVDRKGALLGEHTVSLSRSEGGPPGPPIPPRYRAPSELTAEVTDGDNDIDFELTSE